MAHNSGSLSWWIALLPSLSISIAMILGMWIVTRKRRWRDRKFLGEAVSMPPEHVASEPRTVRDMAAGEEAYIDSYAIVTSKKRRRVFIRWDADLRTAPEDPNSRFAPLRIRRLERGFSLTVRAGGEFRTSPVPWGLYAPVTEIIQATPSSVPQTT
jgi:hypothetical protein